MPQQNAPELESAPAVSEQELVEQANVESAVRLANLDDEEDPRPDQPPLKEGVHTVDPDTDTDTDTDTDMP